MTVKSWITNSLFSGVKSQLQSTSRLIFMLIFFTFVISLIGLISSIIAISSTKSGSVVLIPKENVIMINNQEYIPIKLLG
jgi:hypothetical protein